PAISRLMTDLEAAAGFALFERAGRNTMPTPRARLLLAEVERTLLGLSHLETVFQTLRQGGEGRMSIALPPALLPAFADQLLGPFARLHPDASIAVEVVASFQTFNPKGLRQHDLCVTFEPLGLEGFEEIALAQARAVCLVPAGHPCARRKTPVALRELTGDPFISYWPDAGFRLDVDRLFAAAGLERPLRYEARTTAAVCELVATLGGVSIIPLAGPDIRADRRLAALALEEAPVSAIRFLRPLGALSPLAQAFLAFATTRGLDFERYVSAPTPPLHA
ncbi:MAG TPA: LysR substrate-binding domain-containing protein, partial [Beijerinckiaceae bacterium]|nr:LysR substrate-binding domain-containing protein [Beijerinckiaceae bacterium]